MLCGQSEVEADAAQKLAQGGGLGRVLGMEQGTGQWNACGVGAAQEAIDRERGAFRELGGWRVEVSPGTGRLEDRFLNVLSITDGEDDHREVRAQHVSSRPFDGVAIRDNDGRESTLVLFRRHGEPLTEDAIPTVNCRKLLIVGLGAGEELAIALGPDNVGITPAPPGPAEGTQASTEGTIYTDLDP